MDKFSSIFDSEIFHSKFVPIILELTEDPVAIIRDTIQSKMGDVIYNMQEDKEKENFINTILSYSTSDFFQKRIFFAKVCYSLIGKLQSQEVYDDSFLNKLLKLTKDKVPNVRLIVSKTLFMMLATETYKKNCRNKNCT